MQFHVKKMAFVTYCYVSFLLQYISASVSQFIFRDFSKNNKIQRGRGGGQINQISLLDIMKSVNETQFSNLAKCGQFDPPPRLGR